MKRGGMPHGKRYVLWKHGSSFVFCRKNGHYDSPVGPPFPGQAGIAGNGTSFAPGPAAAFWQAQIVMGFIEVDRIRQAYVILLVVTKPSRTEIVLPGIVEWLRVSVTRPPVHRHRLQACFGVCGTGQIG